MQADKMTSASQMSILGTKRQIKNKTPLNNRVAEALSKIITLLADKYKFCDIFILRTQSSLTVLA
jgi:hypothetical protein